MKTITERKIKGKKSKWMTRFYVKGKYLEVDCIELGLVQCEKNGRTRWR